MSYSSLEIHSSLPVHITGLIPSIALADKNWFRTGGVAQYFAEPATVEALQEVLTIARMYNVPLCMIGEGANMLISDEGVAGIVLRLALRTINRFPFSDTHDIVEAGAGVRFGDLINWCLENNLSGLEEFSGIPGTVGGSVFINIHYYEFLLSHFLIYAQVIDKQTGLVEHVDRDWFNFGYNYSRLHEGTHYLLSARFMLKKVTTEIAFHAQGRSEEMIRHRAKRYPTTGTCGSFFRNFTVAEVAHTSKKLIYVAYYLDKLGIKGELAVGGASVSHQHANMLVNNGTATTSDIIELARTMQQMVYDAFGMVPQPECRLIGFKQYPLLC